MNSTNYWTISMHDQLKQLMKALEEGDYNQHPDPLLVDRCEHKSRHYISFDGREEFDYCEKCEAKL